MTRRPGGGAGGPERGSASLWVALAATVLAGVAAATAVAGAVLVAGHRARAAADLAVLAAADHPDAGCAAALRTAQRNGARLTACWSDRPTCVVTVAVDLPGSARRWGPATATATATADP